MDGLLLAEVLSGVAAQLPSARSTWRFTDERTCELSLAGGVLRIESRPGRARVVYAPEGSGGAAIAAAGDQRPSKRPLTRFQTQLSARAGGDLLAVSQQGLDRIAYFEFAGSTGFVPSPPVTLVLEATGPHANLVLLDAGGTILAVEREARSEQPGRGGGRRLTTGARYRPPPAQPKLDPRKASVAELGSRLIGSDLAAVRRLIDGIGADLFAALSNATGLPADGALAAGQVRRVVAELGRLLASPAAYLAEHAPQRTGSTGSVDRNAVRERLYQEVSKQLGRELKTLRARLSDSEAALAAERTAAPLRAEGDLLLARAADVPAGASRVELTGFEGEVVALAIDPRLSAADNAQERYRRARRVEARARAAAAARDELLESERALRTEIASLAAADIGKLTSLRHAAGSANAPTERGRQARRGRQAARAGIEITDPRGYLVIVGRGAKENDEITFKRARSRDLWLHAQGYRGAHVVVVAGGGKGEQVPFETILFAARLAAGNSEARQSDNVPVDYTERKNVWRKPGGAPGAVNYAHHKTVYVTPARDAAGAAL